MSSADTKIDMEIEDESAEMEIALFTSTWSRTFGFPAILRLDASGSGYMPKSELDKMLRHEDWNLRVPIDASDWDGISRHKRAERIHGLEDTILLGVPYEAMCGALQHEAQALRAQLASVREREEQVRPLQVVMSSVPDLPPGTLVLESSGDFNR